jgi:hypothetical protein
LFWVFLPASTRSVPPGIHFALLLLVVLLWRPLIKLGTISADLDMIKHDQKSLRILIGHARQTCLADLPGRLARQTCPADLPGRLARQTCPADLPGRLARQTCPADLPGRLARQTCPADLPGRLARQKCSLAMTTDKADL